MDLVAGNPNKLVEVTVKAWVSPSESVNGVEGAEPSPVLVVVNVVNPVPATRIRDNKVLIKTSPPVLLVIEALPPAAEELMMKSTAVSVPKEESKRLKVKV